MSAPSSVEIPTRSAERSLLSRLAQPRIWRPLISLVVVLLAWELLGRFVLTNRLFFVPVSSVAEALVSMAADGTLLLHISASFRSVLFGMALAIVVGVAFGVLLGTSRTVSDYTEVYLNALYATPLVAIAPLLILWLGIGIASKIAVVFLISVFPIVISTASGVRNVDRHFIDVARAFGGKRRQIVAKVLMPAALPFLLTGIRLAIGRAIVGVVVGELFGANAGLGYLIYTSGQTFDVPALFAGIVCLAFGGVSLTWALQALERRVVRWKPAALEG
jgi:NitT/TauT family transport system permease protein